MNVARSLVLAVSELNTHMLINEVISGLKTFIATVRVKNGASVTTVKTAVHAEGQMQARAILVRVFGESNVFAVLESQQMTETDGGIIGGTKTLSASELRVKALADQAKKLKDQAKQERARQGLDKAQKRMAKASSVL